MMDDDGLNGRRMPAARLAPPSGAALAERLDAIRDATLGTVRRRTHAGLAARLALGGGGVIAAVVAVVVLLVTSGLPHGSGAPQFAGSPTPSGSAAASAPASPSASPSPVTIPQNNTADGGTPYGLAGATGWYVIGSTLSTTADGGKTWQQRTLPAQLESGFQQASVDSNGDVVAVSTAVDASVVVGVSSAGQSVWRISNYRPRLGFAPPPGQKGPERIRAMVSSSPDGSRVMVVARRDVTMNTSSMSVLTSSDGGRTFTQGDVLTAAAWTSLSVGNTGVAYAIGGGTAENTLMISTDGASWSESSVASWPTGPGALSILGWAATEQIVVNDQASVNGKVRTLTFLVEPKAVDSPYRELDFPAADGTPAFALLNGTRVRALGGGAVRTTGVGNAWVKNGSTDLPGGSAVAFSSASDGIAFVSTGSASAATLYSTSDGGRTWKPVAAGGTTGASSTNASTIARTLLAKVALPPGATPLAASKLDQAPEQEAACAPFYESSEWLSVPGMSPQELDGWMTSHNASTAANEAHGTAGTPGRVDLWFETGNWKGSFPTLHEAPLTLFTAVADGTGAGLRVDVQAIPKGAECNSTGVNTPFTPAATHSAHLT